MTTRPTLSERLAAARAQQATEAQSQIEAHRKAADEMLDKLVLAIGDADTAIASATTTEEIDAAVTAMTERLRDIHPAFTTQTAPASAGTRRGEQSSPEQPRQQQPATRREAQAQQAQEATPRRTATPPPSAPSGGKVKGLLHDLTGFGKSTPN